MDYLARRTAEGLSKRDIIKCLKRYVPREAYRCLLNPQSAADHTSLRQRRQTLDLPTRAVAEHLTRPINAIARLERGIVHDPELTSHHHLRLCTQGEA